MENAPRQGAYTKDIEVHHKPFAVELRNTRCKRCGTWGHAAGDRECQLRNVPTEADNERKTQEDPLARVAGGESSGAPLRWEPKAAPEERKHGGASASDANQQFVPLLDEEEMAAALASQEQSAQLSELDPAVLALLSEKQRKQLLKLYQKELTRELRDGGQVDDEEERKKKRKHKDKKEKKEKRHKSKKRHKHSSRRDPGSSSSADSDSNGG